MKKNQKNGFIKSLFQRILFVFFRALAKTSSILCLWRWKLHGLVVTKSKIINNELFEIVSMQNAAAAAAETKLEPNKVVETKRMRQRSLVGIEFASFVS